MLQEEQYGLEGVKEYNHKDIKVVLKHDGVEYELIGAEIEEYVSLSGDDYE